MELFDAVDDELLWIAAKPGLNYLIYNLKREPAYETFRVGNPVKRVTIRVFNYIFCLTRPS